jgi:hypothetical protein
VYASSQSFVVPVADRFFKHRSNAFDVKHCHFCV